MVDQLVRFGMAITVITLIATGLYQFSGHVEVVEPTTTGSIYHFR